MASHQSVLATKSAANEQPRKKLVHKKSKLGILSIGRDKNKGRAKDFSDIVWGVGAPVSVSGRGGFGIYVDPTVVPDVGDCDSQEEEIPLGIGRHELPGALGEATNIPQATQVEVSTNSTMLKIKADT